MHQTNVSDIWLAFRKNTMYVFVHNESTQTYPSKNQFPKTHYFIRGQSQNT